MYQYMYYEFFNVFVWLFILYFYLVWRFEFMKQVYINYKSQYIYSYIVYGIDGCFIWKKKLKNINYIFLIYVFVFISKMYKI